MLISEDVITAMTRFPPDLRLNIIQYAPEPEWDQFVTGRYNETKQEDNRLLGGGKPVVRSNVPRSVSEWKVDEGEIEASAPGTESGLKGEFRRSDALISPTVKQTAYFGPKPIPLDDDDDVTSTRAPHVSSPLINPPVASPLTPCRTSVRPIFSSGDRRYFRPIRR